MKRLRQYFFFTYSAFREGLALLLKTIDQQIDSKVRILNDAIAQCLKDEKGEHGVFVQARDSNLDLVSLGQRILAFKASVNWKASKAE